MFPENRGPSVRKPNAGKAERLPSFKRSAAICSTMKRLYGLSSLNALMT